MRLKFLLFLFLIAGIVNAQVECDYPEGVIRTLVITEANMTSTSRGYVELTNMGNEAVRLSEFKLGRLTPWVRSSAVNDLCNHLYGEEDQWYTETGDYIFLPDKMLEPGESFVIATAYDYGPEHYKKYLGRLGGSERPKQVEMYEVADKLIHVAESIEGVVYPEDSITTAFNDPEQTVRRGDYALVFNGMRGGTFYLEHHYGELDSAIVDQVGGVFDDGGRNFAHTDIDIAGVEGGLSTSVVVRKFIVKEGNIDFANARGISTEDSEWIAIEIPEGYDNWRDLWWTPGNHDNYILDENTLESDDLEVDFAAKTITVPWGTLRGDDIMRHMKKKPGVAWNYHLNSNVADSVYRSAKTGDQLTIYVVGNELQTATFDIMVDQPTADDNIVIPVDRVRLDPGPVNNNTQDGILNWPRVTRHESGVDTITGSGFGLAYDMRVDTLVKYLEKPANASWEIVWVDGVARPDLKDGDKLKVTSQSGKVKEYHIQVQTYFPSNNADLSSITWPDIPDFYRGIFGWMGDTIPNFTSGTTNYRVEIPYDVEGTPALVAKADDINAKVEVNRARSLSGTIEDRTVSFDVTAEDDTTKKSYMVELVKEKSPGDIEPFIADIFISEFDNSVPNGNAYLELYNPGNQPVDLRNYMVAMRGSADPSSPMTSYADPEEGDWNMRYTTYIPGLRHADLQTWLITPRILQPDINVNPWLQGGETFVLATISRGPPQYYTYDNGDMVPFKDYDVQFRNEDVPGYPNPWNEFVRSSSSGGIPIPPNGNRRNSIFLYKVLNDSVKLGLKPNTDPNDFELIDYWGMAEREYWVIGGVAIPRNQTRHAFIRKPDITKGNPELGGSFGTNPDDCEWTWTRTDDDYGDVPYPDRNQAALYNLGQHYMIEPTFYKSTITSSVYKVSDGYGEGEEIFGIRTGTTVADLYSNLYKADEGQTFKVKSFADGSELSMDMLLSMNDTLVVMSADSVNTTYYRLDVNETGLSSNAVLTSTRFNIEIEVEPKSASADENAGIGSISGFEYGTALQTVVNNITVPAGATLTIVDGDGAYVPIHILNFDTAYVLATVNPDIYFDVLAEDGLTRIVYQLKPETSASDAFILSDLYTVTQKENLVSNVPRGTNFQTFVSNVIPSLGATMKVVDKMGYERTQGAIREDDKIVVTSANGQTERVYHLSMLATQYIQQTTYLAYVLSNVYVVDQVEYVIAGPTGLTTLSDFYARIIPVSGATVVVVDAGGNEKTEGDLDDGDMLKVTSMDGKIEVMYKLALNLTGIDASNVQQIAIYPNPSAGVLNVSGLKPGNRIRVFNAMGVTVRDMKVQSSLKTFSLNDQPAGMYLIVVSDENKLLGRFKAVIN